jgi:hypothetical protein
MNRIETDHLEALKFSPNVVEMMSFLKNLNGKRSDNYMARYKFSNFGQSIKGRRPGN